MKKPIDFGLQFASWKDALISVKDKLSKEDVQELKDFGVEL